MSTSYGVNMKNSIIKLTSILNDLIGVEKVEWDEDSGQLNFWTIKGGDSYYILQYIEHELKLEVISNDCSDFENEHAIINIA